MSKSLLLSLGHGSSAVYLENGEVVCGYEEERLTRVKSDSRFPINAITKITDQHDLDGCEIYISHWFIFGELPDVPNKYYDPLWIARTFPDSPIYSVSTEFTHHDAHAYSALAFTDLDEFTQHDTLVIVADGFGTMGETMSIYTLLDGLPELHHRTFGFSSSLGLMYQYATSYLGMKENQDEYKLLGYESQIDTLCATKDLKTDFIHSFALAEVKRQMKDISKYDTNERFDPICNVDALPALKLKYRDHFDTLLKHLNCDFTDEEKRIVIAYYVQMRLEMSFEAIIKAYGVNNLILSGGVFMNVKLNNSIVQQVKGKVSILPICGDQGAPIGLYDYVNNDFKWPYNLCWGTRSLFTGVMDNRMYSVDSESMAYQFMVDSLNRNKIVNLVRGDMEFGSRALCNTSTIALPTKENVEYINTLNNRSTVMPMAPVIHEDHMDDFFDISYKRVHKSLGYMICTTMFKVMSDFIRGVAHNVPFSNEFTGRPQVVSDSSNPLMAKLCKRFNGPLINTSFNVHGEPIVYSMSDVKSNHAYQVSRDTENRVVTIIVEK